MRPLVPSDLPYHRQAQRDLALASLSRAAIASANALDGSRTIDAVLRTRGWADDRTCRLITRSSQSPTSIADTAALTTVAYAVLDSLKPVSAAADLLPRGHQLSFDGTATIGLPQLVPPANLVGFVGEGAPYPLWQLSATRPELTPFKFGALVELSREMFEGPNSEQLVRMALTDACAAALDRELFSTTAASSTRPGGLLAGITPLTPAVGGGASGDAMITDVAALAAAIAPYAANSPIVLVTAVQQAVQIAFRVLQQESVVVLTSTAIPARTVIMLAPLALVSAIEGTPEITASKVGELHEETAPAQIVVGGVMARPLRSLYQTDTIGVRLRLPLSWRLRNSGAIAFMQNVNW
jgi:hypothetical protein